MTDITEFAQDLYDVLGMNTNFITQQRFFDKYVENDNAFMVDNEGEVQYIYFDDFTITIKKNGNEGLKLLSNEETAEIYINAPEFNGREICVTLTFCDGEATGDRGVIMKYPKLADLTTEMIEKIDRYTCGRISDSGCITPYDVCVVYGRLVGTPGIMNLTGGHDKNMVQDINVRWIEDKEMFEPVLCALYERDAEEILNSDAFTFDDAADLEWVKDYMKHNWDGEAENYLMHIADNQDLEVILKFVRYDRSDH